jgi:1-deoxy-D-xylulose-5-phosphate synthase
VPFDEEWTPVPWGEAEVVREGNDLTFVAYGSMVGLALAAARVLGAQGIEAAVLNARFAKPLDETRLLEWAARTGFLVTLEEGQLAGGFGSAVLELAEERGIDARIRRLGLPDGFIEHGARGELLAEVGLTPDQVAERVSAWLRSPSPV